MKYEVKKVLGAPQILLLLALILVANGGLFWWKCTDDTQGYTLAQMREKYQVRDTLEAQQLELEEYVWSLEAAPQEVEETLLTGDVYREWALNAAVLERVQQVEEYETYRQGLVGESQVKIMLGLFGEEDSFPVRSLRLGIEEYEALQGVTPEPSFSGGVEMLASFGYTDLLFLVFPVVAGLLLLTFEKTAGLSKLTRPTRYGGFRLYGRKWRAMLVVSTLGFVALYGVNAVLSGGLLGWGDLSRPVQSVYGYLGCSMDVSVGEFLGMLAGLKYLWCVGCSALIFALCALAGNAVAVGIGGVALGGLSLVLWQSSSLWLRGVSLAGLARMERAFRGAVYLNWFGQPIHQIPVALILLLGLVCASFFLGLWAFCRVPTTSQEGGWQPPVNWSLPHGYKGLFRQEGHKLLVTLRVGVILVLFVAVQWASYRDFFVVHSEYEYYYRYYSQQLEGAPAQEQEAYLAEEKARLEGLQEEVEELRAQYGDLVDSVASEQLNALRAWQPFQDVLAQYENLSPGQSYLYQSKYLRLYDGQGIGDDVKNLAKLCLVLTFSFFSLFAMEEESGMALLQRTAGRGRAILTRKVIWMALVLLCAAAIAFLPQYWAVFQGYGWPHLTASANSIVLFGYLPQWCSVGMLLLITGLIRLVLAGAVGAGVALLSKKTGSSILTLVLSLGALAILFSALWLGLGMG